MFKEHERIVLTTDVCGDTGEQRRPGNVGVVVLVHPDGEAYVVKLTAPDRDATAIAIILPSQTRPVASVAITHASTIGIAA